MRSECVVLLAFLLAPLADAQIVVEPNPGTVTYLDWRYGFRDLKFEQPIETCKGMVLVEDDGHQKFYTRKDENLEFEGAKLKLVEYGFYKGKLANVTINAEGKTNSVALLKALEKDYGAGLPSPRTHDKLYWFGQRVLADYMASDGGEKCSCGMWSKPMQALRDAGGVLNPQ
jgi:hypothetical protein